MKHAELFAGYGGLSLAVETVFDAELAWYAEFDPAPSKIMARHWPDITNYGDVTTVDWSAVEPVDIISGGSPCQDVSAAGRRAGMTDGTRSNLWIAMREAIATIQPTYVVWENVRGAHSATAHSEVESEPGLLGGAGHPALRATGRVLGDLASLGYDAEWRTLPASSVGAPHRRERVFVLAWRRDAVATHGDGDRIPRGAGESSHGEGARPRNPSGRSTGVPGGPGATAPVALLPTPVAQPSGNTPEDHLRKKPGRERVTDLGILVENGLLTTGGRRLPTPRASHGDKGGPNQRDSAGHFDLPAIGNLLHYTIGEENNAGTAQARPSEVLPGVRSPANPDKVRAGGHMVDLSDVAEHVLLPTPRASDKASEKSRASEGFGKQLGEVARDQCATDFGPYAQAIRRWEAVLGREAPPPTEPSPRGKQRLSAAFCEWMMGLPEGWICDTDGISRNDKIKAAGNGVVPQQAAAALSAMLAHLPPPLSQPNQLPAPPQRGAPLFGDHDD